MLTIRHATAEDKAAIRAISAATTATLRKTYRPNQKALNNKARLNAQLQRLVALSNNTIVGTVQYYIEGQSIKLIGLGVHPDFRRRGISRALIQSLESIGETAGVVSLHLHTIKQTNNVDIFKKLGFSIISENVDDFFESAIYPELTDVKMEKTLSS